MGEAVLRRMVIIFIRRNTQRYSALRPPVGVVFYLLSYFHGIWHILVLLGSFSHYFTILNFVA